MVDNINSQPKSAQYNGPVSSSDFNLKFEQNYKDLVYLYNRSGILDQKLSEVFQRILKDQHFLSMAVLDLEDRIKAIEHQGNSAYKKLSIFSYSQIDIASFVGNLEFQIGTTDALSFDYRYNILTLPLVQNSTHSKIKFFDFSGDQVVPDYLEIKIDNSLNGVDQPNATIDTTPAFYATLDSSEKLWMRNVISDFPSLPGAQMEMYIKIPYQAGSDLVNHIRMTPYPIFGVDIVSISYTKDENPTLSAKDNWVPLNSNRLYNNQIESVGKVPPGAWSQVGADAILNSGPICFYFAPIAITAIRVLFRQRNYIHENDKYVYSYGLSDIDIISQKFLNTGKTIIKYTAPENTTIQNVQEIIPKIYNVPEELLSSAFSYRVIYRDGSVYTLSPVPGSRSVWIEVTLNMLSDGTPPILSDLIVNYV